MSKVNIQAESEWKLGVVFLSAFAVVFGLGVLAVEILGLVLALLVLVVILLAGGLVLIILDDRR